MWPWTSLKIFFLSDFYVVVVITCWCEFCMTKWCCCSFKVLLGSAMSYSDALLAQNAAAIRLYRF